LRNMKTEMELKQARYAADSLCGYGDMMYNLGSDSKFTAPVFLPSSYISDKSYIQGHLLVIHVNGVDVDCKTNSLLQGTLPQTSGRQVITFIKGEGVVYVS